MTHAVAPSAGRPVIGSEAAVRRRVPGNAEQAGRSRRPVPLCQPGDADGRPRRSDLGAGTHAADQSRPAARAARAGRALLPPGIVRSRADLSGDGAEVAGTAGRMRGKGRRSILAEVEIQVEAVAASAAKSSSAGATSPTPISAPRTRSVLLVRTGRPTSTRPASGRPDWGAVSSLQVRHTLRLRPSGQGGARNPVHRLCQPPVPGLGRRTSRLLDLTSGPRFQVFSGIFEDVTLKPFVTGGYVWVNDTPYYGSWGGGLESNALLANGFRNISICGVPGGRTIRTPAICPTNSQYRGNSMTGQHGLPVPDSRRSC